MKWEKVEETEGEWGDKLREGKRGTIQQESLQSAVAFQRRRQRFRAIVTKTPI